MDIHDVIQAFVDGEPVDPVELEQALADPEGRAHLIDLVVLRKLVRRSHVAASLAPGHRADRQPKLHAKAEGPAHVHGRLRAVAAAAIIAIGASVGGYFAGERATTLRMAVTAPAMTSGSETARTGGPEGPPYEQASAPVPAPTVVIRFQPGVDWTEIGGH